MNKSRVILYNVDARATRYAQAWVYGPVSPQKKNAFAEVDYSLVDPALQQSLKYATFEPGNNELNSPGIDLLDTSLCLWKKETTGGSPYFGFVTTNAQTSNYDYLHITFVDTSGVPSAVNMPCLDKLTFHFYPPMPVSITVEAVSEGGETFICAEVDENITQDMEVTLDAEAVTEAIGDIMGFTIYFEPSFITTGEDNEIIYNYVKIWSMELGGEKITINDFFGNIDIHEEISPSCSASPAGDCSFTFAHTDAVPKLEQSINIYSDEYDDDGTLIQEKYLGTYIISDTDNPINHKYTVTGTDYIQMLDDIKSSGIRYGEFQYPAEVINELQTATNIIFGQNFQTYEPISYMSTDTTLDNCRALLNNICFCNQLYVSCARRGSPTFFEATDYSNDDSRYIFGSDKLKKLKIITNKTPQIITYVLWGCEDTSSYGYPIIKTVVSKENPIKQLHITEESYEQFIGSQLVQVNGTHTTIVEDKTAISKCLPNIIFSTTTIEATIRLDDEAVGDYVKIETDKGDMQGLIFSIDIKANTDLTADIKILVCDFPNRNPNS